MKKLLALATFVVFSSLFILSPVVWAGMDCKWVQVEDERGVGYKCIGKDCKQCAKEVESKALKQIGRKCCECFGDGWPICYGDCCDDTVPFSPSITPFKKPGR